MSTRTPSTKILRSPLLAVFIALVFVAGPMPGPVDVVEPATAQATTGLRITAEDYTTNVDVLYGTGSYAYVVLTRASNDTTEQRDLVKGVMVTTKFGSPEATYQILIDLLETGPETGVFVGGFGFTTAPAAIHQPASDAIYGRLGIGSETGKIPVANGVTVTVAATSATDTFVWKRSDPVQVDISGPGGTPMHASSMNILGTTSSLSFNITDPDLNEKSTTVDTWTDIVQVTSDSDPAGRAVTLTETGVNTGVFTGSMQFRTNPEATAAQGNTIFVRHDDRVFSTVVDRRDAAGDRMLLRFPTGTDAAGDPNKWTFKMATTGQILFDRQGDSYVGSTKGGVSNGFDRAVLTVIDADPNQSNRLDTIIGGSANGVTISYTDATGASKTFTPDLEEANPAAVGVATPFRAIIGFNCVGVSGVPSHVQCLPGGIRDGSTITARYADNPLGSEPRRADSTATWRQAATATVILGPNANTDRLFGTETPVNIRVTDTDADRTNGIDTVNVRVKSTSNPTGITVALSEASSTPGVFTGTFRFTGTSGDSARLHVADRDQVMVHYDDRVDATGQPQRVSANDGRFVAWRAESVATVEVAQTNYFLQKEAGTPATYLTRADVFVTDQDQNNPFKRDTLTATAVRLTGDVTTATITLRETGIDTGIFRGTITFGVGSGGDVPVDADKTDFTLEYIDVITPGGNSRSTSAPTATAWRQVALDDNAIILYEKTRNGIPERADTYHLDANARLSGTPSTQVNITVYAPAGIGDLLAKLESTQCTEGTAQGGANEHREVTLTEDTRNPGRYNGTLDIHRHLASSPCETTAPAESTTLAVPLGTSFTTKVTLPSGKVLQKSTAVKERLIEELRFVAKDTTTDVERVGGLNAVTYLRLEKWDHNVDSARREILTQAVKGLSGTSTTNVMLVESGPDTGIFIGSFVFSTTGANDERQEVHVNDVKRLKLPGGTTFNSIKVPAYGMTSGANVTSRTGAMDSLSWWPAPDAKVTVPTAAFGSRPFVVEIEDGDGLAGRKFDSVSTTSGTAAYTFSQGPHVVGSELILLSKVTADRETGPSDSGTYTATISAGPAGHTAAEALGDRNFDGVVDCQDIVLTGTMDPNNPGSNNAPIEAVNMSCLSVVAEPNSPNWTVTYAFKDRFGKTSCTPDASPVLGRACIGNVQSWYRARLVSTCSTSQSSPGSDHEYKREGNTMRFCAAPTASSSLIMTYLLSQRDLVSRSLTDAGTVLDTAAVKATYATNDNGTANVKWIFRASIPVEVTATDAGALHVAGSRTSAVFSFRDLARAYDSQPGSSDLDHLRTIRATETWRAAATATVKVMTPAFAGEASAPVFGPSIPVEIVDADADKGPSYDVITATIETPGQGPFSFTLHETGPKNGIFRGIATAPAGSPLTVRYSDQAGANGEPTSVSKALTTKTAQRAVVQLGTSGDLNTTGTGFTMLATPASANHVQGTLGRLYVLVHDPDADKQSTSFDKVTVRVHSDSERDGPLVELTETAVDSGVFVSSGIQFEDAPLAGNDRIFAKDTLGTDPLRWDRVSAEYEDQDDGEGNRRLVRPTAGGGYTHWNQQFDGIVRFEQPFSIDAASSVACRPIISCAHLTIADADANTDRRVVNVLTVSSTDLKIGTVGSSGEFSGAPGQVLTRLVETGANTGMFIGYATFASANAMETATSLGKIGRANTATIKAEYVDPHAAAGAPTEPFSDTTKWYDKNHGVLAFDQRGYGDSSSPVTLRLYDGNVPGSPVPTTVTVSAKSDADSAGVNVQLTKLSGRNVWQGSFNLRETSGSGAGLLVNDEDTLVASYTDANPAGTRVSTAVVAIGDELAPVTTLTTVPANPDGENGWFITAPTFSLSANENVDSTRYRLNGGGERQYSSPIPITTEGTHTVEFWSIDFAPNTEAKQTLEIKFDATAPTTAVTELKARSQPLGAIELSWAAVSGKTDPLQFGSYKVFQGTTANLVGNSTTETFSHTPASDGTHTYLVAVADAAGNFDASKVVSVSGVSDRVAPRMVSATVSPTELFEEIDLDLTVTITGTVNEADLSDVDRVEANILDPFGNGIANVTMTRQGTTNVWRGTFDDFPGISGEYAFNIAALDVAGNAAPLNRTVMFHAIDRHPPQVTVPETVVQGFPLAVEVKDNDKGIATISYRLDGAAAVNVPVSDGPLTHTFTIPTTTLALGTHSLSITTADLNGTANFATYDVTFTVTDSDGTAPPGTGNAPVLGLLAKFVEHGGMVKLGVGSSGPLTALTVAFDNGAAQSVLSSWGGSTSPTAVSVGSLATGKHTVTVTATNLADTATRTFEIYVLDVGVPLPPGNVEVTKGPDGFPRITWTLSESTNVGGYLVHRSSSPYQVIAVLDAQTTEFTDKTAKAGTTYKYAVTAYGPNQEGFLAKGSPSEATIPWVLEMEGSSFTVDDPGSNFWTVFWVLLVLLVVVSAVVLLVVYRERIFRPSGESGEIYDDDYPDGSGTVTLPFGEQQHELRCPNCTTEFSVTGEKPIVTTCPNCGKKGILR